MENWPFFPKITLQKTDFIIPEKENILEQLKALSDTSFDFYTTYSKKEVQQKMEQFLQGLI